MIEKKLSLGGHYTKIEYLINRFDVIGIFMIHKRHQKTFIVPSSMVLDCFNRMKYVFVILFFGLLNSCNLFESDSTDNESLDFIIKSIEKSGGLWGWKNIDTLTFYKKSILYQVDGAIESNLFQFQNIF